MLRQTQSTIRTAAPNWRPWLLFFLRALQQQELRLAARMERERLAAATVPELSLRILDYSRQHGRVTMGDMIRLTGISRNTLKEHFRNLMKNRQLVRHGKGKGSWNALP